MPSKSVHPSGCQHGCKANSFVCKHFAKNLAVKFWNTNIVPKSKKGKNLVGLPPNTLQSLRLARILPIKQVWKNPNEGFNNFAPNYGRSFINSSRIDSSIDQENSESIWITLTTLQPLRWHESKRHNNAMESSRTTFIRRSVMEMLGGRRRQFKKAKIIVHVYCWNCKQFGVVPLAYADLRLIFCNCRRFFPILIAILGVNSMDSPLF